MSGKDTNNAIDFAISCNYWCVSFVDEDDYLVDLVDDCIVAVWLHYIAHMVSWHLRHIWSLYVVTHRRLRHICILYVPIRCCLRHICALYVPSRCCLRHICALYVVTYCCLRRKCTLYVPSSCCLRHIYTLYVSSSCCLRHICTLYVLTCCHMCAERTSDAGCQFRHARFEIHAVQPYAIHKGLPQPCVLLLQWD